MVAGRSKSRQKGLKRVVTGAGEKSRLCDILELREDHPGNGVRCCWDPGS